MEEVETLRNAPIVEALLNVQVVFPKGVELHRLSEMHRFFRQDFPKMEEVRLVQFNVQFSVHQPPSPSAVASTSDQGLQGYRFISESGQKIVQCLQNGFTFNRLAPYGSWNDFIEEAKFAWECYRNEFPEMQVVRISVRYINRIILPVTDDKIDLEQYFRFKMPGPAGHNFVCGQLLEHCVLRDPVTGLGINWVFAVQPSSNPAELPAILDIDVHAMGAQAEANDPVETWETMRKLKNKLFFSSFTDKGLGLFR